MGYISAGAMPLENIMEIYEHMKQANTTNKLTKALKEKIPIVWLDFGDEMPKGVDELLDKIVKMYPYNRMEAKA